MKYIFRPSIAKGTLAVPPSKSYFHRYLMANALSNHPGKVMFSPSPLSEDIQATMDCLKNFGVRFDCSDGKIDMFKEQVPLGQPLFDCRESGSTLRFLAPLALVFFDTVTFHGSERLMERGINLYKEAFLNQNIQFEIKKDYININGKLHSDDFYLRGDISSQYFTGLLFSLPLLNGDSRIVCTSELVSKNYVDMTMDCLSRFSIRMERKENTIFVPGNQKFQGTDVLVEGDYSNAAFLDAFNFLCGDVMLTGLNPKSIQGDKIYRKLFAKLYQGRAVIDLADCIDLGPVLFAMASVMQGGIFTSVSRLKIKESDRLNDMLAELSKIGVRYHYDEAKDMLLLMEVDVTKCGPVHFESHNDHRIAMALSILLSLVGGTINHSECVAKSYPSFFEDLQKIGIDCHETESKC